MHGETRGDSRGPSCCCCVAKWRETREPGPAAAAAAADGGGDAFAYFAFTGVKLGKPLTFYNFLQ